MVMMMMMEHGIEMRKPIKRDDHDSTIGLAVYAGIVVVIGAQAWIKRNSERGQRLSRLSCLCNARRTHPPPKRRCSTPP
jgi:hypothetical protein